MDGGLDLNDSDIEIVLSEHASLDERPPEPMIWGKPISQLTSEEINKLPAELRLTAITAKIVIHDPNGGQR